MQHTFPGKLQMDVKQLLRFQLEQARGMTQKLLAEFKTREDWLFQVHPQANNAIWVMGHLGLADNFMMKFIVPEGDERPAGFEECFWFGSTPTSDDAKLPSVDEVRNYFDERRTNLMKVLEQISDEKMAETIPAGTPFSNFPNLGQIFAFNAMHEGIHFGQLTVCHRGLGNQPLYR